MACYDFQKGKCRRGESCRFSHDDGGRRGGTARSRGYANDRSKDYRGGRQDGGYQSVRRDRGGRQDGGYHRGGRDAGFSMTPVGEGGYRDRFDGQMGSPRGGRRSYNTRDGGGRGVGGDYRDRIEGDMGLRRGGARSYYNREGGDRGVGEGYRERIEEDVDFRRGGGGGRFDGTGGGGAYGDRGGHRYPGDGEMSFRQRGGRGYDTGRGGFTSPSGQRGDGFPRGERSQFSYDDRSESFHSRRGGNLRNNIDPYDGGRNDVYRYQSSRRSFDFQEADSGRGDNWRNSHESTGGTRHQMYRRERNRTRGNDIRDDGSAGEGIIKRVNEKGFGFIESSLRGCENLYFHCKDMAKFGTFDLLREGDRVAFEKGLDDKSGRAKAVNVQALS